MDQDEGIAAYHGSPHDFEQFDISKIGTGEGAQAYGHGLYFAQNEDVAKEYRDSLSANNPDPIEVDGEKFEKPTRMQRLVANYFGDVDAVLKEMNPNWEYAISTHFSMPKDADELERMLAEDNAIEAHKERFEVEGMRGKSVKYGKPGHMYEVHIKANPEHFLDWDKSFHEQSDHVKDIISPFLTKNSMQGGIKGHEIYEALQNDHGATDWPVSADVKTRKQYRDRAAQRTSDFLSENGIRGIRYLDGGSRDGGEGTHNYVVFNHDHVNVKRKYARGGTV
jgi:uncharacterized protein YkuJ